MSTKNIAVDVKMGKGMGAAGGAAAQKRKRSQAVYVWQRFKKNKIAMLGLFIIFCLIALALLADVIAPGDGVFPGYDIQDLSNTLQYPSFQNIMGTDNFGRDIFSRIAHGSRVSLQVGFVVVSISLVAGVALGALSGFYSGIIDNSIMRSIDILLALPGVLLAISIAAALGAGLTSVIIAVGVGAIPNYARIVRASVLSLREQEFIEAARSIGANDARIVLRHILPNCAAPIIVQATMGMASAILAAAGLSFIGLGIQLPTPEWGAMLSQGRAFIRTFYPMVVFPGLAIAFVIFGLNMLGDGLRDALDPRLKK